MTFTIDPLTLFFVFIGIIGGRLGIYEHGQRKGLKIAEQLYKPLMEAVESNLDRETKGQA